jgi:hypothetical protein
MVITKTSSNGLQQWITQAQCNTWGLCRPNAQKTLHKTQCRGSMCMLPYVWVRDTIKHEAIVPHMCVRGSACTAIAATHDKGASPAEVPQHTHLWVREAIANNLTIHTCVFWDPQHDFCCNTGDTAQGFHDAITSRSGRRTQNTPVGLASRRTGFCTPTNVCVLGATSLQRPQKTRRHHQLKGPEYMHL